MSTETNIRRMSARRPALSYFAGRTVLATTLASISLFLAPQLRAQSEDSQQSAQDVAEAARQARARKQQNPARAHVYTNEDLRRGKILTPDDESRAAATNHKNSSDPAPAKTPDGGSLDANSATSHEPLGDVARRYRNAKKNSPFHLPSNQPELAAPKIIAPLVAPKSNAQPARPRIFMPASPKVPFSRTAAPIAPSLPSPRMGRINPFVGRRTQSTPPAIATIRPVDPRIVPKPKSFSADLLRELSPRATSVVVQPGDTLWNLSRQHLGRGTRWLEFLAANPSLEDPMLLVPGTQLILPPKSTSHRRGAETVTIQPGDSLSKIALSTYGHASAWRCIAQANPSLSNPNLLAIGRSLTLPASCAP